ncbi:protein phosphatase PTC7 homolog isoform X3 [Cotesia typhae]|uniref:protein phosphatase PTC7 homolog isoform X3 n=1 Tax=Cotesia typhae TaxID=2053667 RepID=UPI003D68A721
MQSIYWTGRLLSRALWNGISSYTTCADPAVVKKREASLVSAVCGFPKDLSRGRIRKGQFGDDAWFTAKFKALEVIGSSTACVIVLNKETSSIYAANIGDSGFVIVRKGKVVHRSSEQQHYFNTPFQLSLPPPGHSDLVLSDSPESADTSTFGVENGDVILLATDGVFDNVPDQLLVTEMRKVEGERDPTKIQGVANTIAWMARSLAFDGNFLSPFAQSARQNGIEAIGGKPDDITVLLATIAM